MVVITPAWLFSVTAKATGIPFQLKHLFSFIIHFVNKRPIESYWTRSTSGLYVTHIPTDSTVDRGANEDESSA
jgi:hypothetical protein